MNSMRGLFGMVAVVACGLSLDTANASLYLRFAPLASTDVPQGGTVDVEVYFGESGDNSVNTTGLGIYAGTVQIDRDPLDTGAAFTISNVQGTPSPAFDLSSPQLSPATVSNIAFSGAPLTANGATYEVLWGTFTFTANGNVGDTSTFNVSDWGDFQTYADSQNNPSNYLSSISPDQLQLKIAPVPEPTFLLTGMPFIAAMVIRQRNR